MAERGVGNSSFSNNCKVRRDYVEKIRKGEKLVMCDFLIEEGWMRSIPSKYTFHAVWRAVESEILEQWIIMLGERIVAREEVRGLAVDSSGFN